MEGVGRLASAASSLLRGATMAMDRATSRVASSALPRWEAAGDPFACLLPWELTSRDALTVPPASRAAAAAGATTNADYERGVQLLDFTGVCLLPQAVDSGLISRCCSGADTLTQDVRQLLVRVRLPHRRKPLSLSHARRARLATERLRKGPTITSHDPHLVPHAHGRTRARGVVSVGAAWCGPGRRCGFLLRRRSPA